MRRDCPNPSENKGANAIEGGCDQCCDCGREDEYPGGYDPYEDQSDESPSDFDSPASVNAVSAPCDGPDSVELASDETVQDAHLAEVYAAEEVADGVRRFLPPSRQPLPVNVGPVLPPAPHGRVPPAPVVKATDPRLKPPSAPAR